MTKINKFDLTDAEIDALYLFTADQTVSVQDKRIVRRFARNIAKYLEEWQVAAPVAPRNLSMSMFATRADLEAAKADAFCDANCTWRDHAPGCVRRDSAPQGASK